MPFCGGESLLFVLWKRCSVLGVPVLVLLGPGVRASLLRDPCAGEVHIFRALETSCFPQSEDVHLKLTSLSAAQMVTAQRLRWTLNPNDHRRQN